MSFYTSIADHYDHIFPLRPAQVNFIAGQLPENGTILDIGYASGELPLALAERGFQVTGIDLDPGQVKVARRKVKERGSTADLKVGDMTCLPEDYDDESFDAVICVGNTVVHLADEEQIGAFFGDVLLVLKPGGRFITQIINYDRLFEQDVWELPLIENDFVHFTRRYDRRPDGGIDFITSLTVKEDGQTIDNSVRLYPLVERELRALVNAAGFSKLELFGAFDGRPFEPFESYPLIAVATK